MRADEVPESARDKCRTCKADVIWTVTEAGKDMMVQLASGGAGANLALRLEGGAVRSRVISPRLAFGNRSLHLSHFVLCPDAKLHRRRDTVAGRKAGVRR